MTNYIPRNKEAIIKLCDYCGREEAKFRVFELNWTGFSICKDCKEKQETKNQE